MRGGYRIAHAVGLLEIPADLLENHAEFSRMRAGISSTHAATHPQQRDFNDPAFQKANDMGSD